MPTCDNIFPKHLFQTEKELIQNVEGTEPGDVDQGFPASPARGGADVSQVPLANVPEITGDIHHHHPEPRWLTDPILREKAESMRQRLKDFLAKEDRIKRKTEDLNPQGQPNILLSSYIRPGDRQASYAFWELANELQDLEALGIDESSEEAEAIRVTTALLRDELPVNLTQVALEGDDRKTGWFTLLLGRRRFFPVLLYVCLYDADGGPVHLGRQGILLAGVRNGPIFSAPINPKRAIQAVSNIIRNGGLNCARTW